MLFAISCNTSSNNSADRPAEQVTNELCKMWKEDSTGCSGFRNMANAQMLSRWLDAVNNKMEVDIPASLGKPDDIYNDATGAVYNYTLRRNCAGHDSDLCSINIRQFKSRYSHSITCQ